MTQEQHIEAAYERRFQSQKYKRSNLYYTFKEVTTDAMLTFARQEAIAFINWTLEGDCHYSATDEDQWTHTETGENITTAQLYDIYKPPLGDKENV